MIIDVMRTRRDLVRDLAAEIRGRFPRLPYGEALALAAQAIRVPSRAGWTEPGETRADMIVVAWLRHTKTEYDALCDSCGRDEARRVVSRIVQRWYMWYRGEAVAHPEGSIAA